MKLKSRNVEQDARKLPVGVVQTAAHAFDQNFAVDPRRKILLVGNRHSHVELSSFGCNAHGQRRFLPGAAVNGRRPHNASHLRPLAVLLPVREFGERKKLWLGQHSLCPARAILVSRITGANLPGPVTPSTSTNWLSRCGNLGETLPST